MPAVIVREGKYRAEPRLVISKHTKLTLLYFVANMSFYRNLYTVLMPLQNCKNYEWTILGIFWWDFIGKMPAVIVRECKYRAEPRLVISKHTKPTVIFCSQYVMLNESVVSFGATSKVWKLWVNHIGRFLVRFHRQNACCHCKRGQTQGWAQTSDFKTYQTDFVIFCSQYVMLNESVVSFGATSKL